jgi:inosine-uridine nucleoside N-ribohydrolase
MPRRLWIDTDMGFDDVAAIQMVVASSGIEVAGVSLVAGNAPLDTVRDNAARARHFFGWPMPVHAGASRAILAEAITAQGVLGPDAMRSAGRSLPSAWCVEHGRALDALMAFLEGGGGEILALGPLTNLAILVLARPDLAEHIQRLVWMGGSAGPGNHTAAAEFNAYADPEAAAIVLRAGVPLAMIDLETCRQVKVSLTDVARLRAFGGERATIIADLLEGYVRIASADGTMPMSLYDPVAAAAVITRSTVGFAPARVEIECADQHARGMTVVEWRVPSRGIANAEVSRSADAQSIIEMLHAAFAAATLDGDMSQ